MKTGTNSQQLLDKVKKVALQFDSSGITMNSLAKALLYIPETRLMLSKELDCLPDLLFKPKPLSEESVAIDPGSYDWPSELFETPGLFDDDLEMLMNFDNIGELETTNHKEVNDEDDYDDGNEADDKICDDGVVDDKEEFGFDDEGELDNEVSNEEVDDNNIEDINQLIEKIILNSSGHIWYQRQITDNISELMDRIKQSAENLTALYPFDQPNIKKLSALLGKQCFQKFDKSPKPEKPVIIFTQTGEDELRLIDGLANELTGKIPIVIYGSSDNFDDQVEALTNEQPRIILFRFRTFSNPGTKFNDLMHYFEFGKRHCPTGDLVFTNLDGIKEHTFDKHIIILQLAYPYGFKPASDTLIPVNSQLAGFMQDNLSENNQVFADSSLAERFLQLAKDDLVFTYQAGDAHLLLQYLVDNCELKYRQFFTNTSRQAFSKKNYVHLAALAALAKAKGSLTEMLSEVNSMFYDILEIFNQHVIEYHDFKFEYAIDALKPDYSNTTPDELIGFYSALFDKFRSEDKKLSFYIKYSAASNTILIKQTSISQGLLINGDSYLIPKSDIQFDDVIGLDEAKKRMQMIIDYLADPKEFDSLRVKPAMRILLYGPPGCGKTMIAKAFANHINCPFFSISAAEITSQKYAGFGASLLRKIFHSAKQTTPCVIFLDELDAFGNRAGFNTDGVGYDARSIMNTLLVLLDGIGTDESIIVLGATNRINDLDQALLRPKRFGTCVQMELPGNQQRENLIKKILHPADCLDDHSEMTELILSRTSEELSPAKIEDIIAEIKLKAIANGNKKVSKDDLNEVIDDYLLGKKLKNIQPGLKLSKSYHEAAHAILHRIFFPDTPVEKISIQYRAESFGVTVLNKNKSNEMDFYTDEEMLGLMIVTLGGICAERKRCGRYAAVSSTSFHHALHISMLLSGNMDFGTGYQNNINYAFYEMGNGAAPFPDELRQFATKLLDKAYKIAEEFVNQYWNEIVEVAEMLIKQEVIDKRSFEDIAHNINESVFDHNTLYHQFKDFKNEIGYRKEKA